MRYVLVKWGASGAEAMLALGPILIEQMRQHVERAEAAATNAARLEAYNALQQMIVWLELGQESDSGGTP